MSAAMEPSLFKKLKCAVQPLIDVLACDSIANAPVVWALGRLGGGDVTTILAEAMDREDPEVRSAARCALTLRGDARGRERLTKMLNDGDKAVSARVAEALRKLDEPRKASLAEEQA